MAADLKTIYKAISVEGAEASLSKFAETWDKRYPDGQPVVAVQLAPDHTFF